jgi:hypothetical protein
MKRVGKEAAGHELDGQIRMGALPSKWTRPTT